MRQRGGNLLVKRKRKRRWEKILEHRSIKAEAKATNKQWVLGFLTAKVLYNQNLITHSESH